MFKHILLNIKDGQAQGMINAKNVILEVAKDFEKLTGRKYGLFEEYKMEDAEIGIVVLNSTAGTCKFVVDSLNTRKSDILWRHANQREAIKNRNAIIKANKKIEAERKKALEDAKRQFNGEPEKVETGGKEDEEEEEEEEGEDKAKKNNDDAKVDADGNPLAFNEEEFLQLFDQEHPQTPVPDEVKLDEDNDFDLEEEALPNEGEDEEGEEDDEKKQNSGEGTGSC